jgi:TonB family protein
VDFRPYLIQILATIKRYWFNVWPESARMGRQGRLAIQIAIARDGNVTKLVIASPSGADPLDKAAVSAISAANPLPQLPAEFKGSEVRLQLNFVYNMR